MPQVSVVIPSYNHASFIAEAVQSVFSQTQADLELIVVDDGSTDSSRDVLSGFTDPRLRLIFQENQGAHAAINRGLQEAEGEFLAILNSDDLYHPTRLEKALSAFKENPGAGLVASYIQIIDSDGAELGVKHGYRDCSPWPLPGGASSFRSGDDLRAALLTENYLATTSNYIFTRGLYQRVGEFRPLRYAHDWDFALRAQSQAGILLLSEPLVRYRVHSGNTIRENQAAMVFEICWILAFHLPQAVQEPWFSSAGWETRTRQLLNSIYVFNCEKVLNVLLLQRLDVNTSYALELLDPSNPARKEYLNIIEQQLGGTSAVNSDLSGRTARLSFRKVFKGISGALKKR
jgi:glycosyltransferase involved in cell wall biosynthesis